MTIRDHRLGPVSRRKGAHLDEPSEADLDRIRHWSAVGDWKGLLEFMESIWPDYGVVRRRGLVVGARGGDEPGIRWEFVTGGWSGCEQIINAFYDNTLAHAVLWESTHRGGLHVLLEPDK